MGHGKLMCARGLLMLMHLENLEDFNMFEVTFQLCETILKVTSIDRHKSLSDQNTFIQFLASCQPDQLHDIVIRM